jgi:hypothetical protein
MKPSHGIVAGLLLLVLILLLVVVLRPDLFDAATCGGASPTLVATNDQPTIEACLALAVDGDTINIGAGTATVNMLRVAGKAVTLAGAGVDQTIWVDGSGSAAGIEVILTPGKFVRITGVTMDAAMLSGKTTIGSMLSLRTEPTPAGAPPSRVFDDAFRIDHFRIINIRISGVLMNWYGNLVSGLLDSGRVECPAPTGACQAFRLRASGTQDLKVWAHGWDHNDPRMVTVEDVEFWYNAQQDGGIEGYGGARYELRFSKLHGVTQGHHGFDSGNYAGTMAFRIYANAFDQVGCTGCSGSERKHHFRSGVGVIWGNTYAPEGHKGAMAVVNYRSNPALNYGSFEALGCAVAPEKCHCDGTRTLDGNSALATTGSGYPCRDQIGWLFTNKPDGVATFLGLYGFLNRQGATVVPLQVDSGGRVPADIQPNRDLFNEGDGVGVGPLAMRPATCTPRRGWWATDQGGWNAGSNPRYTGQGELSTCSPMGTWVERVYVPQPYPHRLRTGEDPPDPPDPPEPEGVVDPSAVGFRCPDHGVDDGHEVDILDDDDDVVATIEGGDPSAGEGGVVRIPLDVTSLEPGTYRFVVRAKTKTLESPDSPPSTLWQRSDPTPPDPPQPVAPAAPSTPVPLTEAR